MHVLHSRLTHYVDPHFHRLCLAPLFTASGNLGGLHELVDKRFKLIYFLPVLLVGVGDAFFISGLNADRATVLNGLPGNA